MNTQTAIEIVKATYRTIPDFPKPGVLFRDVTPVFEDPGVFQVAVDLMLEPFQGPRAIDIDRIAAVEARGFLLGAAMALAMPCGLALIRKKGKLPGETLSKTYQLEYGTATIETRKDSIRRGDRVLIVDDLLATGGTAKAVAELVEELGGTVCGMAFLCELPFFKARTQVLSAYSVTAPVVFDGE